MFLDQLLERNAHLFFDGARPLDVTGNLEQLCAGVVRQAERCEHAIEHAGRVAKAERASRRYNQDRLRALNADHPEVTTFCGHNPFEYLYLVAKAGQTPRGICSTPPIWVSAIS